MSFFAEFGWVWLLSLAGFLALWPISVIRRDCSIVDFWWGPGFGVMALAVWLSLGRPTDTYTLAILLPLAVWSVRLGVHLGLRRMAEGHEDPRYAEMREARGTGWWWKSLFVVFVLQAVVQGLAAAGILAGLAAAPAVSADQVTIILAVIAMLAALVEMISDLQLDHYRRKVPVGGLLTTGLRGYVRYPSYAAEIVFWASLSILAFGAGVWWAPASALMIGLLLRFVSGVTILEERLARTRANFAEYQKEVPALMPRLWQNRAHTPAE